MKYTMTVYARSIARQHIARQTLKITNIVTSAFGKYTTLFGHNSFTVLSLKTQSDEMIDNCDKYEITCDIIFESNLYKEHIDSLRWYLVGELPFFSDRLTVTYYEGDDISFLPSSTYQSSEAYAEETKAETEGGK